METVNAQGARRTLPLDELHRLPGDTPQIETNLDRDELITAVTLPPPPAGPQSYRKVRDRASYAFALVSIAWAGEQVALGSVAHKPWRARAAEAAKASGASRAQAAEAELAPARSFGHNDFKIDLARRLIAAGPSGEGA